MRLILLLPLFLLLNFLCTVVYSRESLPSTLDPYAVLRVPRSATNEMIRAAYRTALNVMGRAASKHGHGQDPHTEDMALLSTIGLSYRVLVDAGWRAEWDSAHALPEGHNPTPFPKWDKEEDL